MAKCAPSYEQLTLLLASRDAALCSPGVARPADDAHRPDLDWLDDLEDIVHIPTW